MAEVGASGYLVKQNSGQILVRAVREIARGHPFFSPSIAKRMADAERRNREHGLTREKATQPLTTREAEVLQRVAEGSPNKRIADELGISIKTVEKHRQRLMNRLNIHDTAGLTRHAIATGVIESSVQRTTG
jgi:DNA-binding NarL/FixJ family response regulator